MKILVCLLTALLAVSTLHARNAPKAEKNALPLQIAAGVTIEGDFKIQRFAARGVVRYTGSLRISQNGMTLSTPDKNAWVEVHRDGNFTTSAGTWEVEMKPRKARKKAGPRRR